jgi:cytidylate kinase
MNTTSDLNRCFSFINCQLQPPGLAPGIETSLIRCVTVSRQSGCGAHIFAEKVAACLQARLPQGARPWTVFDRSLVEVVLRDHHLPARLASFMPEDRVGQLNDIIEDLFSLHPPAETLVRRASETILHLAELGNAIIVGRGANVIAARLPGMLHVRLIGSLEQRVAHMRQFDHLDRKDALKRIRREDGGRARYIKRYFGKDVDDPLLYHFVINTDWVALEDAAETVRTFALSRTAPHKALISPAPRNVR